MASSAAPAVWRSDHQPSTVVAGFPCSLYTPIAEGTAQRCYSRQSFYSVEDGRRVDLCCGGRRCRHCGPAHWKRRAVARFLSGLSDAEPLTMFTLTAPGGDLDCEDWNLGASARWHRFRGSVSDLAGSAAVLRTRSHPPARRSPAFWKVAEFQRRGAVHFHGLFRGLPFLPIGLVRSAAVRAGFGPRLEWHAPRDVAGLGRYYSKYVLKDVEQWPRGYRVVTYSRDWSKGWKGRSGGSGEWIRVGRGSLGEALLRL
jgi:hypothetical protein